MSESFTEFLNEIQADPDMIQQALRMHLSERTNDLTSKEMFIELHESALDEDELDKDLKQLEHNPDALEQAALIYFDQAWQDEAQRPSIRAAFKHGKDRLPVIETAIIAIVGMYAMWLIATGGETYRRITRNLDGSYEEIVKREPFAPIVSAMTNLTRTNE